MAHHDQIRLQGTGRARDFGDGLARDHLAPRRRLGGYTGDGLGATQQVTEVAALLALALALGTAP